MIFGVLADGQPLAIKRVEGGMGYAQRGIRVRLRKPVESTNEVQNAD